MVSKISKAAGASQSEGTAKIVVPREDPVLRARRILAETEAKAKISAESQLTNAVAAQVRANANVEKWARIQAEANAKVLLLQERAGLNTETAEVEAD